ncbi:thiol:disulfide interchange protein DsbA/DsbL [Agaribacter marinus]|uniref:Thiol:disulfide interchange protein n=1 Tax=Agaribacter marinus TaxID=1431249 RepID=A0AA37T063_9ALTE|nr:thiol:disulfide interchange protein DsbA/DsbL [Agaribacter marinus]GLR71205.1 thiol:disulfide interchange protein [Agaribacter marinus]
MKKFLLGLSIALLFPLQALAQVTLWQEGTHYTVISDKASAKPVVQEYFSFWCPACFRFEPLMQEVKSKLDDGVKFDKIHVNFMRFTSPEIQDAATRAMMIGRQLKLDNKLNDAIFSLIHVQGKGQEIKSIDDFKAAFVANGVDSEEFDKLASSFGVTSLVNRNNKQIQKNRENISGVPNVIVNGKYQIKGGVKSAEEYVQLVNWLAKQK